MHRGTIGALGGKLHKKPNIKLRPLHDHLGFPAPAHLADLGWGRGGLQGGASGSAWVWEDDGGGTIPGASCGRELVEAPLPVAYLGLDGDHGPVPGACKERVSRV